MKNNVTKINNTKTNVWYRTLLFVYNMLDMVAESIDKLVEQQAMNSFYYSSNFSDNDVMTVAEKIIALSERKVRLINIKVATDNSLKECPVELAQLLIEHYIDNDICEDVAKRHNMVLRTFYRKLQKAEGEFANNMIEKGYTEERIREEFKEDRWVIDIYKKFLSKCFREEVHLLEQEQELC